MSPELLSLAGSTRTGASASKVAPSPGCQIGADVGSSLHFLPRLLECPQDMGFGPPYDLRERTQKLSCL